MQITEKPIENTLVLELEGDLMGGTAAEEFRKVIDQAIHKQMVNVIVDMTQVNWMNSSGLGMLISALTTLRSSDGDLRLANLSERLRRPIKITKLDSVFQDFDTLEEAIKSYTV